MKHFFFTSFIVCTTFLVMDDSAFAQKGNSSAQDERKELGTVINKPLELENEAIARDPIATEAMKGLSTQYAELDKKRKLLPTGEVEKDRKVVQAISEIEKKEKEIVANESKLQKVKSDASKIQKRFSDAQLSLQKAKAADAADSNRPKKKNGK